jgi:hypothetical protein
LAGVTAGLLGFAFAAIAILLAMPKQPSPRFQAARRQVVSVLLSTSLLVGVSLVLSIAAMIVDQSTAAPAWLTAFLISTLLVSLLGLLLSGVSLALLLRVVS